MFSLDSIVPWGRSFEEYERMFALSARDLRGRILGCADGPASFNAQATARGMDVTSADPLYHWSRAALAARIDATRETVLDETRRHVADFRWDRLPTVEALWTERRTAMETFLADFERGRAEGRYVEGALPDLPFSDDAFDLAICSHFLFLYSDRLDLDFHRSALIELCRLAPDVRIFPLLALGGQVSPLVEPVTAFCLERGWTIAFERVPYEFQRGGHTMMKIRAAPPAAGV